MRVKRLRKKDSLVLTKEGKEIVSSVEEFIGDLTKRYPNVDPSDLWYCVCSAATFILCRYDLDVMEFYTKTKKRLSLKK